jgi:hypothetical protein
VSLLWVAYCAAFGAMLAASGFGLDSYQFWAIYLAFLGAFCFGAISQERKP